jgi:hypothetical protein
MIDDEIVCSDLKMKDETCLDIEIVQNMMIDFDVFRHNI